MAQQKHSTYLPINGLDTDKPAEYIDDTNSPNCVNINLDHSVLTKRSGTTQMDVVISGTDADILASAEFKANDIDKFVRIGAKQAQVWNSGTAEFDNITTAALATTDTDEVTTCAPLLNASRILVFTSGQYNPQKYTGSGNHTDLGGSPPKAKYCESFGPYTLLAHITDDGGSTYRNRVAWCDTGDPENWTTGVAGYKDLLDSQNLTGIKLFGNYVTVHSIERIYLGYLVSTSAIFRFDAKYTPGTVANGTIRMLPNGFLCYLAQDGLRLFNGQTSELVTGKINDDLKQQMNYSHIYRSWGVVVQEADEYWFGVPLGSNTYAKDVYRFNYKTGNIYKDNYSDANIRTVSKFSNTISLTWDQDSGSWDEATDRWNDGTNTVNFPLPVLHTDDGYSYYKDASKTADALGAVSAIYETKDYKLQADGQMARWTQLEVWAKGNSVNVAYSIDSGETWYEITTLALSSSYPVDSAPLMCYFDVVSSKIRFRFYNANATETFALKQFVMRYNEREFRGA